MINKCAKIYCSEDISLIENYHEAISDQTKTWDVHHRKECDENGRTLFTKKQLIDMGLYYRRPASELIFVTRSMHFKLHRAINSIPILQFTKDGTFVKEWPSLSEAYRQLGILQSTICDCLKGRYKQAGGFVWRYK